MSIIISNDCIKGGNISEEEGYRFTALASDLGLPPGVWPDQIKTTLGNAQPFLLQRYETRDGDVSSVYYRQLYGCLTLRIFND